MSGMRARRQHLQQQLRLFHGMRFVGRGRPPHFHDLLRHRVGPVRKFFGNTGAEFHRERRIAHKVLQ